ncbi:hypothetical protein [Crocosphaera sp. XPORK-15E]|uniref:hypothetical protein n=1 Tax=Crocosphaera sp. XPORK-15E TaxID=3110247 RepID=UPI002B218D44|nr:hypothetical protein [Crocosphaera sp. XPORK-15E]MEA5533085.1 hypothetical protein [Crocosphaera sp. XPORK-15E]
MKENKINFYHLILWVVISIIFTIIQIQHSLRQGQLALPPSFDDVAYFDDALTRLRIFYDGGVLSLLTSHIEKPPHSPLSTLIPFLGFAFFGIRDWAPSAINFILVFLLLLFIDYLSGNLPIAWKIFIVITSLTWLIPGHLIIECRPDIFCGLLMASFVVLITERPWLAASKNRHFMVGILIGFALLSKPAISPVTIVLAISAIGIVTLIEIFAGGYKVQWKQIIIPVIRCFGVAILIALPHYLFAFKKVVQYIYQTLVVDIDIWQPIERSLLEDILFYLTGFGGKMMLNNWLYLWLFIAIITVTIVIYKKDWGSMVRVSGLAGGILITYTIVTVSEHKTPFTGVVFPCFFLFTYVMMITYIIQYYLTVKKVALRRIILLTLASIFSISLLLFQWPATNDTAAPRSGSLAETRYYNQRLEQIYQTISNNIPEVSQENYDVYITSVSHWLHYANLRYYSEKVGDRRLIFAHYPKSDDTKLMIDKIQQSDFIITFKPDNSEVPSWLPSSRVQSEILDFLEQNSNFKLLKTYTNPYTDGTIFLYSRTK